MKIFKENQRMADSTFNKIILILIIILLGKTVYNAIIEGFNTISIFSVVVLFLGVLVFIVFKLKTTITEKGIEAKITPFNVYNKTFNWSEIKKCEVVKYSAVKEYGGWGYRRSKNGIAINPSGDKGLKIFFKDGTQILLGTKKPDELSEFLKSIKH